MQIAWFATLTSADQSVLSAAALQWIRDSVAQVDGIVRGLVMTPWTLEDLYFEDGPPPCLMLQLYFDDIADLERALAQDGALYRLAQSPELAGLQGEEQAMLARPYAVPDPVFQTPQGQPHCSFMVHYPGAAEDFHAWLAYYLANHTRIMAGFPDIRQIEVCSRLDWTSALDWPKVAYMQRNKVVYDDGPALRRAQLSPVLQEMRADFHQFPPFSGANIHHAMKTWTVFCGCRT